MTVDAGYLRHLIFLTAGRPVSAREITELSEVLDVREEVLPYLLLHEGGFKDSPAFLAKLAALVDSAPGQRATPRPLDTVDLVSLGRLETELKVAIKAQIDRDLADADGWARLDLAFKNVATSLPATSFDANLRVGAQAR